MKTFEPITQEEDRIATLIVGSAFAVHKALGPGLLESIYEICFCHELAKRKLTFERQKTIPIVYDGIRFEDSPRIDVMVEGKVICELKAVDAILPVHKAQLISYLKLSKKRLGFLINFNVPRIKEGIERFAL